jgi:hypothetical protein
MKIMRGQKGEQRPIPQRPQELRVGGVQAGRRYLSMPQPAYRIVPLAIVVFYDIILGQRLRLPR